MSKLKSMTDWEKLEKLIAAGTKSDEIRAVNEVELVTHLESRVKGQATIVKDVARLLRLQLAKKSRSRPLCNLLFLGPTGTGKTELAKAICEHLYGNEKALLRFDCSEFSSSIAKDRLIGVPTGYVGAEQGGQLTRPVMDNPRRVILFDEIEKAYPAVFDLFLQLMGEARLTEQGSGKTIDYSQCIIILTSNALADSLGPLAKQFDDPIERLNAIKGHLADTQIFRPEILGRIDKVYVFEALQGMVVAEIALLKIKKLGEEYNLCVDFVQPELIAKALSANKKISRFGVRELERIIFDMFADEFSQARDRGDVSVSVEFEQGKVVVKKPSKAA
jgi:ATP-dependent Clp protease ATP-binding subunit ClpA